jgi:hypothetical protein
VINLGVTIKKRQLAVAPKRGNVVLYYPAEQEDVGAELVVDDCVDENEVTLDTVGVQLRVLVDSGVAEDMEEVEEAEEDEEVDKIEELEEADDVLEA